LHVEPLVDKREWEDFLQFSADGTFYHSLKWKDVVEKSFHDSPTYLTIRNSNGIVGICPGFIQASKHTKIYSSMPYSDYGGPVIVRDSLEQASHLLREYLQRFCSTLGVAYLSINFVHDNETFFGSPKGYVDTSQGTVEIDLGATSSDFLWSSLFSSNRRRKIMRHERRYTIEQARTKSDLRDFYSVYCQNLKYIGGHPYPYEFLENMWTLLYPQNLRIWLVGKEEPVGGKLVLKDSKGSYSLLLGIDRAAAGTPSIYELLVWKEIQAAEEDGCRYVSLGGTPSDPRDPYHLRKVSFGGSFNQQKVVRYPCSYVGHVLLAARATAAASWRTIGRFLPLHMKNRLRYSVGRHLGA
jgi:hypothetical protein